ncbi:MAG: aspartate-semialdehyde dehydrogenase [Planctomycetes bacterium]|nr:aspartate-semialdehyde dehydrogenase [Planctomycetota bacterium]
MPRNVIAIAGATGAVGLETLRILEDRRFPTDEVRCLASRRSAIVAKAGGVAIDDSSTFRMDPEVPLVVPEVNRDALRSHRGIVSIPNCSTTQMVLALKPLHDFGRLTRVAATTFQSVSGAGLRAVDEMKRETEAVLAGGAFRREIFPHPIAFNAIPQIPQSKAFGEGGYTTEEWKMMKETRKILGIPDLRITATCVRIPVERGHSEAILVETEKKISAAQARELLAAMPGIEVIDDPAAQSYPLATSSAGRDPVAVGRIREDTSVPCGLHLWIVSDNLRKGAALNAVQIAECLLERGA